MRRFTWRSLSFLVYWLLGVVAIVWMGTRVDGYMAHVMGLPLPHPYPLKGVFLTVGIQTAEALIFYLLIRPETYRHSWRRAVVAFLLSLLLSVFFAFTLMHAAPYWVVYWLWLCCATLVLLILLGVSTIYATRVRAA